jgi:hypothetical protein
MIEQKSWESFRNAGLLWFINQTLHLFGWALVYNPDTKDVYPARVKFRGFPEEVNSSGYIKLSEYLKSNAEELVKESKE